MVRTTILTCRGSVRLPGTLIQNVPLGRSSAFSIQGGDDFRWDTGTYFWEKESSGSEPLRFFLGRGDPGLFNFHFMKVDFLCSAAFGDSWWYLSVQAFKSAFNPEVCPAFEPEFLSNRSIPLVLRNQTPHHLSSVQNLCWLTIMVDYTTQYTGAYLGL